MKPVETYLAADCAIFTMRGGFKSGSNAKMKKPSISMKKTSHMTLIGNNSKAPSEPTKTNSTIATPHKWRLEPTQS